MRIPSGITDQYLYFVSVDATDFVTRESHVNGFAVARSRNGAAAVAMTTPTLASMGGAMPGVYSLLLDEDMSVAAGNYSEEMVFHITSTDGHTAPLTRVIELYNDRMTVATGGIAALASGGGQTANLVETLTTNVAAIEVSITYATKGIQDNIIPEFALIDASLSYATKGIKTDIVPKLEIATGGIAALASGGGHTADLVETLTTNVGLIETSITFATKGIQDDIIPRLITATGQLATLATGTQHEFSAIDASLSYATKGIQDQVIPKLNTATGNIVAIATGGAKSSEISALNDISVANVLTTQMTEAYAADGVAPTLAQAIFLIQQQLGDFAISGTTLTTKKLDGSATAATFTLNDGTAPTSITRSG